MTAVVLGLGSNLGPRRGQLADAVTSLANWPATSLRGVSRLYESAYVGPGPDQAPYLNACVELETDLTAREVLEGAQELESAAGRERPHSSAPRTLDVDLLLFGLQVIGEADLVVPHPRLRQRRFVLEPLRDLGPGRRVPPGAETVAELAARVATAGPPVRAVAPRDWWEGVRS